MCRYFKFGFCKFGDHCRNLHVEEKCDDKQCDISNCDKRHPRPCTFYRYYGRCKYSDYCKYEHIQAGANILTNKFESEINRLENVVNEKVSIIRKLGNEIETNIERLDVLEKMLTKKENIIEEIYDMLKNVKEKVDSIDKINDDKVKALEMNIKKQNKEYTDHCIKVLAAKTDEVCMGEGCMGVQKEIIDFLDNVKDEHDDQYDDKEELEGQDTTDHLDQTFFNPSLGFSCEKCDFVAKNAGGLKTHIKRKHKNFH